MPRPFCGSCSPDGKERSQQFCRFHFSDSCIDFRNMVACWLRKKTSAMLDSAAFRIGCAIIQPFEPREGNGSRAHCAGFQRHMQIAVCKPL